MMDDRAIRSTFQSGETLPPLRQRWRKKYFTKRPRGQPEKDEAAQESVKQQQTTTDRIL